MSVNNTTTPKELNQDTEPKKRKFSFSSFSAMKKCPAKRLLGDPEPFDLPQFLVGHGSELYICEGEQAFEKWIREGYAKSKDSSGNWILEPIRPAAFRPPSKKDIETWENYQQAIIYIGNKEDYLLPSGRKPTAKRIEIFLDLLSTPPFEPRESEYAWVRQARKIGQVAREKCPWIMDIINHPDTIFQEKIDFRMHGEEWTSIPDIINPTLRIIVDLKTTADLHKASFEYDADKKKNVRKIFIEQWEYLLQAGLYLEASRQKYGIQFDYYLAVGSKQKIPSADFYPEYTVLEICANHQEDFDEIERLVEETKKDLKRFRLYMNYLEDKKTGLPPQQCGKHECSYCRDKRIIEKPVHWKTLK